MANVKNQYGQEVDFEAVASLMDDGIRERVHYDSVVWEIGGGAAVGEQEFFNAYCARHRAAFGEEFEPNKRNGQW